MCDCEPITSSRTPSPQMARRWTRYQLWGGWNNSTYRDHNPKSTIYFGHFFRGPTRGPSYSTFHWNIWICTSWTLPFVPFFWRVSMSLHFLAVSIPLSLWATCGLGFLVSVRCFNLNPNLDGAFKIFFIFTPKFWGNDPLWRCASFSKGVGEKPPTSHVSWPLKSRSLNFWGPLIDPIGFFFTLPIEESSDPEVNSSSPEPKKLPYFFDGAQKSQKPNHRLDV